MPICPGCRAEFSRDESALYDGYFHTLPECWAVFTRVLGAEYSDPGLFGRVHQLTVDAYAVQHAGGPHPDKSVAVHLAGLHLVLEQGNAPPAVPPLLQRLAARVAEWPHFVPPERSGALTVADVASAGSPDEHAVAARAWAEAVWGAWEAHHEAVAAFVAAHL